MEKKRVLIVDDEQDVRETLESVLQKIDYHPLTAAHGEEALEIIRNQKVDIVLSDLYMPVMNGIELLKRVGESLRPGGLVVCQFFWHPESDLSARKTWILHLLARLTFGYRQFEAGDHLKQKEFLHAFVDEKSIRTEFAESGFDVLHLVFFQNYKAGGAILEKRTALSVHAD